jgi:hypothetical protein
MVLQRMHRLRFRFPGSLDDEQEIKISLELDRSEAGVLLDSIDEEDSTYIPTEEEKAAAEKKKQNQFSNSDNIKKADIVLNPNVKLFGVYFLETQLLKTDGDISLYVDATGKKDAALILVGNDEETIGLMTLPYLREFPRFYRAKSLIDADPSDVKAMALEMVNEYEAP